MASWQYVFLFPPSDSRLIPSLGLRALCGSWLEFDDIIRLCIRVDEAGHLVDAGEEVRLKPPFLENVADFLVQGRSFSIQARSINLSVSCQFFMESGNPHISIGWSSQLLENSDQPLIVSFWNSILEFAFKSRAAYVIVVDDAPDFFEDRFIQIGSARYLDLTVNHQYGLGVKEVWINHSLGATPPDGPTFGVVQQMKLGYTRLPVAQSGN